jgi:hypothetical protein
MVQWTNGSEAQRTIEPLNRWKQSSNLTVLRYVWANSVVPLDRHKILDAASSRSELYPDPGSADRKYPADELHG